MIWKEPVSLEWKTDGSVPFTYLEGAMLGLREAGISSTHLSSLPRL